MQTQRLRVSRPNRIGDALTFHHHRFAVARVGQGLQEAVDDRSLALAAVGAEPQRRQRVRPAFEPELACGDRVRERSQVGALGAALRVGVALKHLLLVDKILQRCDGIDVAGSNDRACECKSPFGVALSQQFHGELAGCQGVALVPCVLLLVGRANDLVATHVEESLAALVQAAVGCTARSVIRAARRHRPENTIQSHRLALRADEGRKTRRPGAIGDVARERVLAGFERIKYGAQVRRCFEEIAHPGTAGRGHIGQSRRFGSGHGYGRRGWSIRHGASGGRSRCRDDIACRRRVEESRGEKPGDEADAKRHTANIKPFTVHE